MILLTIYAVWGERQKEGKGQRRREEWNRKGKRERKGKERTVRRLCGFSPACRPADPATPLGKKWVR